jgi:hypothetical protein
VFNGAPLSESFKVGREEMFEDILMTEHTLVHILDPKIVGPKSYLRKLIEGYPERRRDYFLTKFREAYSNECSWLDDESRSGNKNIQLFMGIKDYARSHNKKAYC